MQVGNVPDLVEINLGIFDDLVMVKFNESFHIATHGLGVDFSSKPGSLESQ